MSWLFDDITKSLYFCWVWKVVCFHFVFLSPYLVKIFTGVFMGESRWYLGFDLIYSRGKNKCVGGIYWIAPDCSSDPFSTLQCPVLTWRDCLNRNPLDSGFQQKTPAEGRKGMREDSKIGAGRNLQLKAIASLKAACST